MAFSHDLLHVLIESFAKERKSNLLSFLPQDVQNEVMANPISIPKFSPEHLEYGYAISHIHYSWYLPTLQKYPSEILPWVLSLFKEKERNYFQKHLSKVNAITLTDSARRFFLDKFYSDFFSHTGFLVPRDYLTHTPLSKLLQLSKSQLVTLITMLGIFDLRYALKKVLDPARLKSIVSLLTKSEHQFLKKISLKQDLYGLRIDLLKGWNNKDRTSLRVVLQKAGLKRLAIGIGQQHPSFKLHLAYKLDRGRGSLLIDPTFSTSASAPVVQYMTESILYVTNALL